MENVGSDKEKDHSLYQRPQLPGRLILEDRRPGSGVEKGEKERRRDEQHRPVSGDQGNGDAVPSQAAGKADDTAMVDPQDQNCSGQPVKKTGDSHGQCGVEPHGNTGVAGKTAVVPDDTQFISREGPVQDKPEQDDDADRPEDGGGKS